LKVLILGSQGFIGSHLVSYFENLGIDTVQVDIGVIDTKKTMRLDPMQPDFRTIFASTQPDFCVNCSGAANVPESFKDPLLDFTLNTSRLFEMLSAIRLESPHTRFLNLSSAAVYGNPTDSPITELTSIKPLSPYGLHKHMAERICSEFSTHHSVGTHSLRIFSAYGPGLRKQLLWDVYQKALASNTVELFGTGDETRDFVYVSDIAKAVHCVINSDYFDGRATNVASGNSVSVRSVASALLTALGLERDLTFSGQGRIGDPVAWTASISCLKAMGMNDFTTFDHGINQVATWLKGELIGETNGR
jgi:UDP-glucose 4-epimerase